MGIEKDSQEQGVAAVEQGCSCDVCAYYKNLEEAAYDKGYDDGWQARDEMAGRNLKVAEDLAYDNGWIAGANAVINRKPYSALAGR